MAIKIADLSQLRAAAVLGTFFIAKQVAVVSMTKSRSI